MAVNGLDALRAVGAAEAVEGLGFPTGRIRFSSGTGKPLGAMPIGPTLGDGSAARTIRRTELYAALHDLAVGRGIPVHHGRKLVAIDQGADAITATFEDGSTETGAVLIGADGLRSRTRTLIDPAAPEPRYTGTGNVGGFTRTAAAQPDGGDYRMVWGKRSFFGYAVAPDGEVWWFANPPAREPLAAGELGELTPAQRKARLVTLFAGDEGPAEEIVASTPGTILWDDGYDLPRVPTWHAGRAVVVGDAAHAVSPATGQGVSLACEDAVVLAQCLCASPSPMEAFAAYERLRRARVERVAAWGAKMGGTKTPGPIMRPLLNLVLPLIFKAGSTPKAMAKQAWLFDHHLELPDARAAEDARTS